MMFIYLKSSNIGVIYGDGYSKKYLITLKITSMSLRVKLLLHS